jgi:hypothetical protein
LSASSCHGYTTAAPLPHGLLPQALGRPWTPPTLANVISSMPKTSIGSTTTKLSVQETPVIATGGNLSSEQSPRPMDDEYPLEDFLPMFFPPVLASVEVGPGWSPPGPFLNPCARNPPWSYMLLWHFRHFSFLPPRAECGLTTSLYMTVHPMKSTLNYTNSRCNQINKRTSNIF